MRFQHAPEIRRDHPDLVAGVLHVDGITATAPDASLGARIAGHTARAAARLGGGTESDLPEIQAWRRAFARMGLKPTKYRCAAEQLLRRYRLRGALPHIHPLVDLCNAVSLAYAIPVAALDLAGVDGDLTVRPATGTEDYRTLSGEPEHPDPGEVIFADSAGRAHARRWTNRQSGHSTVRPDTSRVLIVAEALHPTAAPDVAALTAALAEDLRALWPVAPRAAILTAAEPACAVAG
jgi:DNA/RNA-binding domain of Phe-tRNA-synthetase-like protein